MKISVIICCYNSQSRLPETLRHLAFQKVPSDFLWEVVLVDNNSIDDTATIAQNIWKELGAPVELSLVQEKTPGLSHARKKGVIEAKGEIIVFCDDDNWFNPNYLKVVCGIFDEQKNVMIIGGTGIEKTDSDKFPAWFSHVKQRYAVGSYSNTSGYVDSVYGAGMALKKNIADIIFNHNYSFKLKDRTGNSLSSGGDTEICYITRLLGFKIWWQVNNSFIHFIPQSRLSKRYAISLVSEAGNTKFRLIGLMSLIHGDNISKSTFNQLKRDIRKLFFSIRFLFRPTNYTLFLFQVLPILVFWKNVIVSFNQYKKFYKKEYWT